MTVTPETAPARPGLADTLAVYLKPRVLIVLFLGFSAGLPLALSGSTLLVWMTGGEGRPRHHRAVRAGRHALHDQVPVGAGGRCPRCPVLRPSSRPPTRLADLFAVLSDRCHRLPRVLRSGEHAVAGRARRPPGRHRLGDPGHRHRRLPHREPAQGRAGLRHGVVRRGLPDRHAGLDRGRAFPGHRASRAWGSAGTTPGPPAT